MTYDITNINNPIPYQGDQQVIVGVTVNPLNQTQAKKIIGKQEKDK